MNESTPIVITPTTCSNTLKDAIASVSNQTVRTEHLIVIDGIEHAYKIDSILKSTPHDTESVHVCVLPFNTGSNGFYGHRIFAAFPHLLNHKYVLFLDQDNWYCDDHVEHLIGKIDLKYDFAYSLRRICDIDGDFVCNDDCESLGRFPTFLDDNSFLIDTSAYCFSGDFIRKYCHAWHHGWGADRQFFNSVKNIATYACSRKYTLNYRLGGNENSVTKEFFIQGNNVMKVKYKDLPFFPWNR